MVLNTIPAKIAPELREFARPIADARPHPDNARVHDLAAIAKSLQAHGQRAVIVVQASTGLIVKGNGTWTAAAQLLGWTELAQLWQEMTDEQALAYLLADNKASDGSSYDPEKLPRALNKMIEGPGLLDTLWSLAEAEDVIESAVGMTTLAPAETEAEYADPGLKDRLEERRAGARQMRLVQVTLTEVEHAAFMGWLTELRKRWETSGWISTIYEAVKRQAESEAIVDAVPELGLAIEADRVNAIRADVAREIRDKVMAVPDRLTPPWLYAQLQPIIFAGERSAPARNERDAVGRDVIPVPADPPTTEGELFKTDQPQSFDIPAGGAS